VFERAKTYLALDHAATVIVHAMLFNIITMHRDNTLSKMDRYLKASTVGTQIRTATSKRKMNQEGGLMFQRENERTLFDLNALKRRNKELDCGVI
jgi:hypothetical protein